MALQVLLGVGKAASHLLSALCSLLTCSGTSPEDPLPAGGGEDEDEEGAAELPVAMAPEVPQEPQEPRSPQQVGPLLRPAELKPSARQASPGSCGPCSPVWAPSRQP